ncbi:hypothetical protein ASC61_07910 [Aeromicrobium sp. Root344]|uniref:hypothetical protein n=1 Tax=Aeromicrobium sp. Root344 TaxID=1736521 RepID=UPI0006FAD0B9|nr:hypothetical protein [Aeromicrobium sp. Root344]KQV74927.1 hypothetical protein ASC61_07910 [Aeromicrobium sp. Root344]
MVTRTDGPFEYWKVTGDAVRAAAEAPGTNAGVIQSLAGELEGDEVRAANAIEGDIEAGVRANPAEAKKVAHSLAVKGQYAVGLLRSFGQMVDEFDNTVNQINVDYHTRYRSTVFGMQHQPEVRSGDEKIDYDAIAARIEADLKGRYHQAQATIDDSADEIATRFKQGPTDENVRELIRAGLIPLTAATLFPDLKLTDADKVEYYKHAVANGLLPNFADMSDDEVKDYLADNPQVSDDIVAIMTASQLPPALLKLVDVQAKVDAALLNDALDDKNPSSETLALIDKANARLAAINASIADNDGDGKPDKLMTAAQASYITNWTNTVGADNLTKVAGVVREAVSSIAPGAPSDVLTQMANSHLRPISDAILNITNTDVQEKGATPLPMCTVDNPSGRPYPQAIRDLLDLRVGESHDGYRYGSGEGFDSIKGLEAVKGWADLLGTASEDVEGGDLFSQHLGEQAIHVKQDLNAILASANGLNREDLGDWDGEYDPIPELRDLPGIKAMLDDGAASNLLSVASRNEDGASALLLNEGDRKALLGLNWTDDTGVIDVIRSGTDRDPAHGGGGEMQSRAALALIKDVGDNQAGYLGGRYDSDGDGDIDKKDAVALGRMTEGISDAVVDAGINWVDQFGDAHDSSQQNTAGEHGFEMNPSVESNFLRFVSGTGDEDAVRFHAAATWDAQQQITDAMRNGDAGDVKAAIDRAGRLEGRIVGADMEHQVDVAAGKDAGDNQAADEKYSAKQRQMAALRMVADIGVSVIPGAKAAEGAGALAQAGVSMFNASSGKVQSGFLDALFSAGSPPEDSHAHEIKVTGDWAAQAANDSQTVQRRIVVQAALEAGTLSPEGYESLYTKENGHYVVKPDLDAEALKDPYFDLGLDEGTYDSGWQSGFNGRDHDRIGGSGGWLDEKSAKSNLYGSTADTWDDDKEKHYTNDYTGPESDADPYNADPSKNDDYDELLDKYGVR